MNRPALAWHAGRVECRVEIDATATQRHGDRAAGERVGAVYHGRQGKRAARLDDEPFAKRDGHGPDGVGICHDETTRYEPVIDGEGEFAWCVDQRTIADGARGRIVCDTNALREGPRRIVETGGFDGEDLRRG